jgi:type I restriction-modification system DNA methylase subunit
MTDTKTPKKDNNALFNRKLLQKAITAQGILKNGDIPDKHKKIIERRLSNQDIHKKAKELAQSHDFLVFFKELLGYKSVGDQHNAKAWDVETELTGIDYALGEFSKNEKTVLVPFEFKSPKTYDLTRPMLNRKESTVAQATRYAVDSQGTAKWFLVSNCLEFRLYKFPESNRHYEQWFIEELIKPEEYARFVLLLSKTNLLGGATEKLFNDSQQQEKDITAQLYRDYRQLRIDLINGLKKDNNSIRRKTMVRLSQKLLDRILFIAFAEDRDLLPHNTLHDRIYGKYAGMTVWDVVKKLFTDIDKGNKPFNIPAYNGGLFAPDAELENLIVSDELLKKFKTLYDYDFDNDIGTPVLGHIFEQSIADLDEIYETVSEEQELQSIVKATGTTGKRKQDGIVYTPEFITDYIIQHTLGGYLAKKQANIIHELDSAAYWLAYREILANTRVLDPACGSGAFLIGAFKYLKNEYDFVNQRINKLDAKHADLFGLDLDAEILNNNLFGVDLNPESIEITQLALWLETAERGKKLKPLDKNIQQGNSIIHHKHTDKQAFLWNVQFNKVMETGGFDVVLGNPPYVRQERLSAIKPYLQEHYQTYHGVADLYTYFFELGLNLLKKGGRLGYISSSTFFRTNSGTPLREFLKVQSNLLSVIDFNDYPVFEGVTTYPAILILEKPDRARKQAPKSEFQFLNITAKKDPQHHALRQQLQSDFGVMKQAALKADAWQLEDERFANLRQKITKGYKTLKDVYGSPYRGVLTGLNEAFVIDEQQYAHLKQDDPNGTILKPFLEGKDLKRWRAESRGLYLILFPKGWTYKQLGYSETADSLVPTRCVGMPSQRAALHSTPQRGEAEFPRGAWELDDDFSVHPELVEGEMEKSETSEVKPLMLRQAQHERFNLNESEAWAYLENNYPNIAKHLSGYTTQARKRGDKGYFWWELRACAYYEKFSESKLVYPDLSQGSKFHIDESSSLFPNTGYFITSDDKYLLSLLNSKVIWFFLRGISDAMKGGEWRVRLFSQNIERIPIPTADADQQKTIANLAEQCQTNATARYELEQKVQRRFIENFRPNNNAEPLNTKLSQWWKLETVTELANEARKAFKLKKAETLKVDLSNPTKQDEWETYLKNNTRQWQDYTQTIHALEQQINEAVYSLFNLDDEEKKLIEQNN